MPAGVLKWPFAVWYWAALLPLAAALVRRRHGWLAAAFAVSWVADTVAVVLPPADRWMVSAVYPVSQAGLVYLALARPRVAGTLLAVTGLIAVVAATLGTLYGPDAALRVVIALSVVWLVRDRADLGAIRTGLVVYFGGGALCWAWLPFLRDRPDVFLWPWLGYQGCRMVGLGFVTWGAWHDRAA